jgi:excisionase family DNA binding protein
MSVKTAEKVYRTAEAAELMSVNQETLLRAIRSDALPAKKLGRGYRIKASDLTAWFDSLPDAS